MPRGIRWDEKPEATKEMKRVNALLTLVMNYDPDAARRLCGEMDEPDWKGLIDGLKQRIEIGKVDGGGQFSPKALNDICLTESVSEILNYAGGWKSVVSTCQKVKEEHQKCWLLFDNPPALTNKAQDLILQHLRNTIRVEVLKKVARLSKWK